MKQERLLSQHPPIVVATPGRLWKLMSEVRMSAVMNVSSVTYVHAAFHYGPISTVGTSPIQDRRKCPD